MISLFRLFLKPDDVWSEVENPPTSPKFEPGPEKQIADAVREYIENSDHDYASHIFIHPVLFRKMLLNYCNNVNQPYNSRGYQNMYFKWANISLEIRMVDVKEDVNLILVGDENAYNDYVMEREILGGNH